MLINGRSAGLDEVVLEEDRVSVYPVFERLNLKGVSRVREKPLRTLKFIVDKDLQELAESLQAMGMDACFRGHLGREQTLQVAKEEGRILLTLERDLLGSPGLDRLIVLKPGSLHAHVTQVIQALDLSSLDRRLRPEWFRSYLLNPAEYRPGTLMPPLWPGGQATVRDVLGGDAERQIAAICSFIKEGEGLPEGFPDRSSGLYELIPTDRAILQRTFFEGTGTKAILVGFPGGINLAYDGSGARPAVVWRGAFFDAYQTWYSRHAPFEKPLGDDIAALGETGAETGRRFRGYRLDGSGNPAFLFEDGEREVTERYSVNDGKLVREFTWTDGTAPAVTHPDGVAVETKAEGRTLTFIYSWK